MILKNFHDKTNVYCSFSQKETYTYLKAANYKTHNIALASSWNNKQKLVP